MGASIGVWRTASPGTTSKPPGRLGWTAIKNGELLTLAASYFDVFVTVDRNLCFQQNLIVFEIAVVVIRAKSNRLADLRPLVPNLLQAIESARPGSPEFIGLP
jgi:hypothetical protein